MDAPKDEERLGGLDILLAPRLGLFGGSFDPVHLGHLHVARTALAEFELDLVLFVPAARSPHKEQPTSASPADRLKMLELALAAEPKFALSDLELRRGAPSFTVDTVRELIQARSGLASAELFLILGSDNLRGLGSWRDVDEVLRSATPIVVARAGVDLAELSKLSGLSAELLERLRRGFVDAETVDIAATELREELERGAGMEKLPAPVREYISARGIYGA